MPSGSPTSALTTSARRPSVRDLGGGLFGRGAVAEEVDDNVGAALCKCSAMARPMPRPDPVITAILLEKSK